MQTNHNVLLTFLFQFKKIQSLEDKKLLQRPKYLIKNLSFFPPAHPWNIAREKIKGL
tara:strand:+ start:8868 stop:9038 length:171 start_codon:yes stop_codon:yes gene_type:complete